MARPACWSHPRTPWHSQPRSSGWLRIPRWLSDWPKRGAGTYCTISAGRRSSMNGWRATQPPSILRGGARGEHPKARARQSTGDRQEQSAGRIFQTERLGSGDRSVGVDAPIGCDVPDPDAPARGAPLDDGAQRSQEWLLGNEASEQGAKGGRGPGEPQRRRQVGVPDAHPEPLHLAAGPGEQLTLGDPRCGVLDPGVLAQGAIHPAERCLVHTHRPLGGRVPEGDHVGDPQPEAVAVGEADRRVVPKPSRRHSPLRFPRVHPEKVLPYAKDGGTDQPLQTTALLREELEPIGRGKAAVEADFAVALDELAQDALRAGSLRAV